MNANDASLTSQCGRTDATPEARVARILRSKGPDALGYLQRRGRERFLRELQEDGLSLGAAVEIIDRHERRLSSEELERVLAELKARHSQER